MTEWALTQTIVLRAFALEKNELVFEEKAERC